MSLARDIVDRIFSPNRDVHAIPVLDGGFSPNQRLEQAAVLADIAHPDSIAVGPDNRIYVSSGSAILIFPADGSGNAASFANLSGATGALAFAVDGRLLVAVAGQGIVALDGAGREAGRLSEAGGAPLACITAIAVAADGSIVLTDGSRQNGPESWLQDLMQKSPPSGRLVACASDLTGATVIKGGLSWPAGVAVARGETELLVSEAWTHRLLAISRRDGATRVLVKNFTGYPGRIARSPSRGFWMAFFALRTQLTEFVLREDAFRNRMMEKVEPDLWIGPSLGGRFDYREPTQVGRIKKLSIQKPWAPPRSYGLVVRIDDGGYAVESLHSRVSGSLHGITDMAERDGRLLVVSKGHSKLAEADLSATGELNG